jgi:sterol desaturase/sphingolipid hydroxylase (fatty acid hydroxylase superfamily)
MEHASFLALLQRLGLRMLAQGTGFAALVFLVSTLLVILIEIRHGRDVAFYRTRSFVTNVLYSILYRGGIFFVLIWSVVVSVFESQLAFLRLPVLAGLPLILSMPVYYLLGDLALYWMHRLMHANRVLWAFHGVHHAQTDLSTLSQSRRHPVEGLLNGLTLYVPFAFFLGLPTRHWIPVYVVSQVLEALQHAQVEWRFGPLYRWVVSPVFHSIHHSADPRDHDRNFGLMFSFWDYLFGTAAERESMPERYGVDGLTMPESVTLQVALPFKQLVAGRRQIAGAAVTPPRASPRTPG